MIRLIKPYKEFEIGKMYDFGCVINARLIKKGIAISIKVADYKIEKKCLG
jgi:hypothetical protein